ncbi:hypothetical protein ACIBG8_02780 [Nonomuraea sp. NPDC050556]|uniref:hypothetical protein n=1 Tax=Nonomuraea sp. NPDC050556 TaxID=3364369 RepID=UPI00378F7F6D
MARADRPALTTPTETARLAVWRIEPARIVSALARYTGDFGDPPWDPDRVGASARERAVLLRKAGYLS